ncbi:MAG: hypothetical protein LBL69_06675 [Zoogloeaceae bacterium]|jgi:hypothetical protein|nr:hypothetical protein [Zoogloeaceae bacterium]
MSRRKTPRTIAQKKTRLHFGKADSCFAESHCRGFVNLPRFRVVKFYELLTLSPLGFHRHFPQCHRFQKELEHQEHEKKDSFDADGASAQRHLVGGVGNARIDGLPVEK